MDHFGGCVWPLDLFWLYAALGTSTSSLNHTDGATPNSHLPTSHVLPPPIPLPTATNGQEVRLDIPKPLPPHHGNTADFERAMENVSAYAVIML